MKMILVEEIIKRIAPIDFIGDKRISIQSPVQATSLEIQDQNITWVSDKNYDYLNRINSGTIVISDKVDKGLLKTTCNYIIVEKPRLAFQQILETFFVEKEEPIINKTAQIHSISKVGQRAFIGHGVVIEKDCSIGDDVVIDHNTVIKRGTKIGNGVKIGCNCTIGGMGFGYEKNDNGTYQFIPHLGNVVISDSVEIGNCTTIDRAVMGSTFIGKNCKIDNLVHIAHGVQLGVNSLVIANAMVAGSVTIGENVWVAPSSSILNNKSVGDNATIGMGAVVLKDVAPNQIVIGNPGKPLNR
jgi:UDP-3-O-[3-hydroxymyristoyl] glucosamine N-acyltransferase